MKALQDKLWLSHNIGDGYLMKGSGGIWKIAYYPIFECGKTGEKYMEPRALVEQPKRYKHSLGTDFREVPLRYLKRT